MTEYKNRQRRNDIHISGVLEEKTKQKRENAIELVVKIKYMNLFIKKKPKREQDGTQKLASPDRI